VATYRPFAVRVADRHRNPPHPGLSAGYVRALRSGPEQIDAVVRTGGSAQIPRFVEMLGGIFGPERVVLSDVFSGVTAGLAIRAGMDVSSTSNCAPFDARQRAQGRRHFKTLPLEVNASNRRWQPRSPAMVAGLSDRIWTVKELLTTVVPPVNT